MEEQERELRVLKLIENKRKQYSSRREIDALVQNVWNVYQSEQKPNWTDHKVPSDKA